MFRSGKYKHFQDRRMYSDQELKNIYKQTTTSPGERVAITRELNSRAGKTPLHSPQSRRQRAMQWAMMNANNTVGILQREVSELYSLTRYVSVAEARKIYAHIDDVNNAITTLEVTIARSKRLFPSKKSLKEKENA